MLIDYKARDLRQQILMDHYFFRGFLFGVGWTLVLMFATLWAMGVI